MKNIIIFVGILAYATAAPVVFLAQTYPGKSTLTKSHQVVDHGSTYHATLLHAAPQTSKTTVTKSSQLVNHGSTHIVHAVPVIHQHEPVHVQVHQHEPVHVQVHQHEPVHVQVHQHEPVHVQVHEPVHVHEQVHVAHEPVHLHQAKSSQYFHLETSHAPKVAVHLHEPLVHVHEPVQVQAHTHRIGDSAVSHQSSTVHETVPYIKYGLH